METRYWIARLRKLSDDLETLAVIASAKAVDADGATRTALQDGKSLAYQETKKLVLDVLHDLVLRSAGQGRA